MKAIELPSPNAKQKLMMNIIMYSVLLSEWFLFSLFRFSFVMSVVLLVQLQCFIDFIVSLRFEHFAGNFEVEFMMMSGDFTSLIDWVTLIIEGDGHWFVSVSYTHLTLPTKA